MSTQGLQGCKELCEDPASLRLALTRALAGLGPSIFTHLQNQGP